MRCLISLRALPVFTGLALALGILQTCQAQESWDAIYIAGSKVGYIHLKVERLKHAGQDLIRVRYDMVFKIRRDRDSVTIEQSYGTIEKPDGEVLKLATRTYTGNDQILTEGAVTDGKMVLTLNGGGQVKRDEIAWGADVRGPYAAELSLSREPIKPGETRDVKTYIPEMNKVCTTHMEARDLEELALGGVKRKLLKIESKVLGPDGKPVPSLDTTYWIDDGGQILKAFMNTLGGIEVFRTTKEAALSPGEHLDFLAASIIKCRKIPGWETTRDVVYRITMPDDDPMKVFPTDRRQTATKGPGQHTILLEVRTADANSGQPGSESVAEEFRRPNPLVNSDDPKVISLAETAAGKLADPWSKAVAIEKWVADNIREKNFGVAFATAREVARRLEGDCTEHSVLVAAMCRAQGIPSRVAIGLVYADDRSGFGFHMWDEVYVNRRWVAIDAAFQQTDVDAVHIKLADSSLDGIAPNEAFLPVVRVFKKVSIEPVEIR